MSIKLAHLTTVDLSLRYLVLPQLVGGVEQGWETVAISAPGPDVEFVESHGVRHIPLPSSSRGWNLRSDLRAMFDLWKILKVENVDILHTHNPKPGLYGRVLGRLAGVPIVVNTVHGLYATPDDRLPKRAVVYGLEAFASRFSDAELIQSSEDLALLTGHRISPPHRTSLLGNGIDLDRFRPDRFDATVRHEMRASLGIAPAQIVVGIVGRLVAEKGYPELIEAAGKLDDRYVVLAIGPDDPDKSDALGREFVAEAAENGVQLLGMRTDVDRLYAAMDLFVLPSHREGYPRAAMEAAASGLPVIATDIRGCREVVIDGDNGLLIPVRRPDAIAAAITKLGSDPALRDRMALAARIRAIDHFDERAVVRRVFAAYQGVARRKGLTDIAESVPVDVDSISIRPAETRDIPFLADLHRQAIDTGFLARLGPSFLERLYTAMLERPDHVVLVADGGSRPVGFVAGVGSVGGLYKHFLRHHAVGASFSVGLRLLNPATIKRAIETLRYDGDHGGVAAELLAMAVDPVARRRGVASRLGADFLAGMHELKNEAVKVVVGADNLSAVAAYQKMGFADAGSIEVHAGEESRVLVWRPSV